MPDFKPSDINRVRRVPGRGQYDSETIYRIVDDALICHVAFVQDGQPFAIPTLHARRENEILLHGATASRLMRHIASGQQLCIAVTHVDGIVLARSVFHHSINYRSVVLFGRGYLLEEDAAKTEALACFTERLLPGRWDDTRPPNRKELKATAVAVIPIETGSAKIRSGPPGDEEEDYALPYWAGVLPLVQTMQQPEPDGRLADHIKLPDYIREYIESKNS